MPSWHHCTERETIRQNADAIHAVSSSVSTISASVKTLVGQVSRLSDLLERTAVSETEIKAIRSDQEAQWRRIDETLREVKIVAETGRDLVRSVEILQRDLTEGLRIAKEDAVEAKQAATEAKEKIDKLENAPGKTLIQILKYIATAVLTALAVSYIKQ